MDLVRRVVCSAFKPSPAGTLPRARGVDLLRAPRRIRTHPNASHGRERKDQPDGEPEREAAARVDAGGPAALDRERPRGRRQRREAAHQRSALRRRDAGAGRGGQARGARSDVI
eukprot:30342-Pelagococcus_subviridis.AAC.5